MTLSESLKKVAKDVVKTTKQKGKEVIANENARKQSQKTAWKDMGDDIRARNIESYGGHSPAIIWVASNKVYATDAYKNNVIEIHGDEAESFRSSSEGAATIAQTSRSGFGDVSPVDAEIPAYLTGAPQKDKDRTPPRRRRKAKGIARGIAMTYEEWMGLK